MHRNMRTTLAFMALMPLFAAGFPSVNNADLEGCGNSPADIVFVLDESGSIYGPDFDKQLAFVNSVIDVFSISKKLVHVGLETFASNVRTIFRLAQYNDETTMKKHVSSVKQSRGVTSTSDALSQMRQDMFSASVARPDVPHIAIVITDGESENPPKTASEAARAHRDGITVFAIGVGHAVNKNELKAIASSPEYVFTVNDYAALDTLRAILAWTACQVTTLPPPTTPTTTPTTTVPTTTLPQMIEGCGSSFPMDVLFSISDQAGRIDTEYALDFVKNIVNEFEISPIQVQAGLTPRMCEQSEGIRLRDHDTTEGLHGAIDRRRLTGTRTDLQLGYMLGEGFTQALGARDDAAKFGILVIDNESSNLQETLQAAEDAARQGIDLMVIGVGDFVNDGELDEIASRPDYVFTVDSYEQLVGIKDQVIDAQCNRIRELGFGGGRSP